MATFARFNGLTSITLTPMLITLIMGMVTTNSAHAEQYCKSVDQSGNASYTLAPESGCNKKKFKTIAVSHHITPQVATQTPNQQTEKSADKAPAGIQTTPTTTVATTPSAATPESTTKTPISTATTTSTKTSTINPPVTKQPNIPTSRRNKDCTTPVCD
ncbi:MAG: hypothetical protein H7Z73_02945 [Candidatus Saccharibacteria bacterium]|nr:hypothetical protein [Moraxellaceae bacterium]